MRICIIYHESTTPSTGMGGRHHYLARELVKLGHDVSVVCAKNHHLLRDDVNSGALPDEEIVDGYRLLRIRVYKYRHAHDFRRVLSWLSFSVQLPKLNRRLGWAPDVVLYSSPQLVGYLGAERLARKSDARLVFEVRDIWPATLVEIGNFNLTHPFIKVLRWIEKRAYKYSDCVVSNLEGAFSHMRESGMDQNKFTWIPNGICLDEAEQLEALSPRIRSLIPTSGFRLVYTGTFGSANALHTLMEAAELLLDLPDLVILLAGQGRMRAELKARQDSKQLSNVVFLESIPKPQVQSLLKECDACYIGWLNSSLYRWGVAANKIPEYLYSGRPIVHGFSGSYDPIARFQAGITVPAEDPVSLAEAIRRLYHMTEEQRRQVGENGRRAAIAYYSYRHLARRLEGSLSGVPHTNTDEMA